MKRIKIAIAILLLIIARTSTAQISPPGLGDANTASWLAFGLRQDLDSAKRTQSMTYVGFGRKSDPTNYNPFYKPAIFVLNQEFYRLVNAHWHYSLALSYRRQHEYEDNAPYESTTPDLRQEFRIYGRLSYVIKFGERFKLVTTYRQEFMEFYTTDFQEWSPESAEIRSRFRVQGQFELNKTHKLIASYEALFETEKQNNGSSSYWNTYGYAESRVCFYYSISPKESSFMYNIGYMNDLLGRSPVTSASYLALDVIWKNPFKAKKKITKVHENLE